MRISSSIALWASWFPLSKAILDNYPNFNGGTVPWIDTLKTTSYPKYFYRKRAYGTAPQHCVNQANENGFCSPYKIEVYDVYYADCHAPWVVCRCTDTPAAYSMDVISKNIGRIPPRARSWVRHYSFYPATDKGYAAFSTYNDISVFGDWSTSTLLFHEGGHNLDYWVGGLYSNTATWQNLAAQDTCVATQYSKSSWAEHFAEMSVQATYEENIGPIPVDTTCMSHTLTRSRSLLRPAIKIVSGDICIDRIIPAPSICLGPDARAQGYCNDVPDSIAFPGASAKKVSSDGPVFIQYESDQREFDARMAKRFSATVEKRSEKAFKA